MTAPLEAGQELAAPAVHEQVTLTPIPLEIRVPADRNAAHVFAVYKTWGSKGWKDIELARDAKSQTWTGEISCHEVSTVTGDALFYLVALDAKGQVVGGSGSPAAPHTTRIVNELPEGAPIAVRCFDPSDCPSDFPGAGCPVHVRKRSSCDKDRDCGKSATCAWDGYCQSAADTVIPDGDLELALQSLRTRLAR